MNKPISFFEVAKWAGVDDEIAKRARNSRAPKIMVSGRLASGKDTIASALMETLDYPDSIKISFASALRDELNTIIDIVRKNQNIDNAVKDVADNFKLSDKLVKKTVTLTSEALKENFNADANTRSKYIRLALQEWGTDVRRSVDPDYWVKLGSRDALFAMADNKAVHITDARFSNEVEIARALGFYAIRLVVDLPIRSQRLLDRDGLILDLDAENHPSEVVLDNYKGFDQWVSNNKSIDDTLRSIIQAFEYAYNY